MPAKKQSSESSPSTIRFKDVPSAQVALTAVQECVEAGTENPFVQVIMGFGPDEGDRVVEIMKEAGHLLVKEEFEDDEQEEKSNIASENHSVAAGIMMVCGAMLERGAPCAEDLAPQFFQRIKVAMQQALASKGKNKDAAKALKRMYLPIVAAFSVSEEVRRKGAPQEVRDVLEKCLAEDIEYDLQWLLRMINIKEGEEIVVIDSETKVGCILSLHGISDVSQLSVLLNFFFPKSKDDKWDSQSQKPKRPPMRYNWNCWNAHCGLDLDPQTYDLVTQPHVLSSMISQEASIDEIPHVTVDGHRHRVVVLAPPLYQRNLDAKGVFQNMEPGIDLVKRLSDDEVKQWMEGCIQFAKDANSKKEEKEEESKEKKAYPKRKAFPEQDDDYDSDGDSSSDAEWETDDEDEA